MPQQDPLSIQHRQIVNKRLSLNLLIQGAATHAHWSAHHLVADRINKLDPQLLSIYDEVMLRSRISYWFGGITLILGNPAGFWKLIEDDGHEFGFHPFMMKHGHGLAIKTLDDVKRRCEAAGIPIDGKQNEIDAMQAYYQTIDIEDDHLAELESLAKDVCHEIYKIDRSLLDAELTSTPRFGTIREPESIMGQMVLDCMMGWSAVVRNNGRLEVKAKATFWPLLLHELVKGTVELICLNGMNEWTDEEYEIALKHTDHIEFEVPMLQIGGTMFQQFLAVKPKEISLAESIMFVSKMDPLVLEAFMFQMFESPNRATGMIRAAAKTN